jgi:WD40 repeat protein
MDVTRSLQYTDFGITPWSASARPWLPRARRWRQVSRACQLAMTNRADKDMTLNMASRREVSGPFSKRFLAALFSIVRAFLSSMLLLAVACDTPAQPVKTIAAYDRAIWCAAFSPSQDIVATGGLDEAIKIWSVPDLTLKQTIRAHKTNVRSLAFSPDGALLASGSVDETVKLWSFPDGTEKVVLKGHKGEVTCLQFSPDGRCLATGGFGESVCLWSVSDGKKLWCTEWHGVVETLAWCGNDIIAVGGLDAEATGSGGLKLLDAANGKVTRVCDVEHWPVAAVYIPSVGYLVYAEGKKGKLRFWDVKQAKEQKSITIGEPLQALCASPKGPFLFGAVMKTLSSSELFAIELESGKVAKVAEIRPGGATGPTFLAQSKDGKYLVGGGMTGALMLWEIENLSPKAERKKEKGDM